MFIIAVIIALTIGISSIVGMVKYSKKQKKMEADWADFIEKYPSKNDREKS